MPYHPEQMKQAIKNMLQQVKEAIYLTVADLTVTAWITVKPVPFTRRIIGARKELTVGQQWGNPGDWAWFRIRGVIPARPAAQTAAPATETAGEPDGNDRIVLLINVGGEACVYDETGNPLQGLTNPASSFDRALGDPGKRVVYLKEPPQPGQPGQPGQPLQLWVQGVTRDLFGKYRDDGRLREAALALCREEVRQLYYDMAFLNDLMLNLAADSARRERLLFHLSAAVDALPLSGFSAAQVRRARSILAPDLQMRAGAPSLTVSALGNSHIDLAWLWPLADTVHKGVRTFATALMLLDRYPAYIFGASQPQLYQWLKRDYPALYARIQPRVREGRWETLGGMWVEADTNLPGGESLIRQILYGKRFFREEFDQESAILWLPDSFGFSGALPQLARKAGLDYFCSTKLSWNLFNQYPHHTFHWKGIDGSALLAHLPPEGTYNSSAAPRAVLRAEHDYRDKGISDRCLMLYGIGDGGGGPGEEHLEWLVRERDCAGLAPVRQETALAFFRDIASGTAPYPIWEGELYLERHQGVYTTQARSKRYNRKMELALHDLELWATLANWLTGASYPARQIESIWKEVLLYQFHDIMAGSAIQQVYRESLARYEVMRQTVETMIDWAVHTLARSIDSAAAKPVLILNSTSWTRREWLKIEEQWHHVTVPPLGYSVCDAAAGGTAAGSTAADSTAAPLPLPGSPCATSGLLEHDLLRLEFGADGALLAVYDKENGREALAPGVPGNRLAVYQDSGDAWDIPIGYADREPDYFRLRRATARVDGPRAELRQIYDFGNSVLEQIIRITWGSRRIDFITMVDWRERHKMLRTAFAVGVRHPETACEIQFGNIRRPNYRNTSWDAAKYEVCAHKWVDLSDGGYGVALMNDCKYGYKVFENILDLNLLRSPVYPDPSADAAVHEFTYSLYPHAGDLVAGRVVPAGYELNLPLRHLPITRPSGPAGAPARAQTLPDRFSLVETEADNIIVETVKKAEDCEAAAPQIILRLYECGGRATRTRLRFRGAAPAAIEWVDLMERPCQPAWGEDGELLFGPFEIHTLKLTMGS